MPFTADYHSGQTSTSFPGDRKVGAIPVDALDQERELAKHPVEHHERPGSVGDKDGPSLPIYKVNALGFVESTIKTHNGIHIE